MNGNYICPVCSFKWTGRVDILNIESCSACGRVGKAEISLAEYLSLAIRAWGREILADGDRLYAVATDLIHGSENEKRIFRIACESKIYAAYVSLDELSARAENSRSIMILTEHYFLADRWARLAVGWVMSALGYKSAPKSRKQGTGAKDKPKAKPGARKSKTEARNGSSQNGARQNGTRQNGGYTEVHTSNRHISVSGSNTTVRITGNGSDISVDTGGGGVRIGFGGGTIQINNNSANNNVFSVNGTTFNTGDTKIQGFFLPEGVREIKDREYRSRLDVTQLYIPPSVRRIGARAFSDCVSLSDIRFSSGLKEIGSYAFADCVSLGSLELPDGLELLCDGAFFGCVGLSSIRLPRTPIAIKSEAFSGCVSLTKLSLGGATEIGNRAFANCVSLTQLDLPLSLKRVGREAFSLSPFAFVFYEGGIEEWNKITFDYSFATSGLKDTGLYLDGGMTYIKPEQIDSKGKIR